VLVKDGVQLSVNVLTGVSVSEAVQVNVLVGGRGVTVFVGTSVGTLVLVGGTGVNVPVAVGGAPTTISALAVSSPLPLSNTVRLTV
jgi:hypothetical protein